jgi:hypothetical protein
LRKLTTNVHWSGDRKQLVLTGWARLTWDLAWLRDKLDRDSLYDAAVVLDDLLQIYSASHTYEIAHDVGGIEVVRALVRPAIAGGFARAGLMRNLCDHIEFLRQRVETIDGDRTQNEERLTAALVLQQEARAALLAAPEPPGKDLAQDVAPLPPLLAEFLGPHTGVVDALAGFDPTVHRGLNTALADVHDANALDHDLVITEVSKVVLDALAPCPDFKGDVTQSVQVVLDQLIRFVSRRMNTQESSKDYLFKDDADEHDLYADLYDWLCNGPLSGVTNVEVQEVGAGRVDIQLSFPLLPGAQVRRDDGARGSEGQVHQADGHVSSDRRADRFPGCAAAGPAQGQGPGANSWWPDRGTCTP